MTYFLVWCFVTATLHGVVYYFDISWLVLPVLLFIVFLASGGPTFPRIFFRTFYRDLSMFIPLVFNVLKALHYNSKNYNITDIFSKTVNKYPHKIAFRFEDRSWTFREVDDYTNRIANFFKSKGYEKGDVVALFMENRPEYVFMWLGLAKIGVISSLINFNLRLDSLLHCITVSEAKGLILSSDYSDAIADIFNKLPNSMQYFSHGGNSNIPATSLDQNLRHVSTEPPTIDYEKSFTDVLLYIFTSGTTGLPKPTLIRTYKLFLISGMANLFNIRHNDVIYCTLPLYHSSGGVLGVSFCLVLGATLVIRRKFSASRFFEECIEYKATVVQYIGEMCRYLLLQPPRPSDSRHSIRLALGNGLRPKIWPEFQSRFKIKRIGEFYGSTEGTCASINTDNTAGSCGFTSRIFPWLLPSKVVRVDEQTGEILRDDQGMAINCQPGQPGEFVAKISKESKSGASMMSRFDGYLSKTDTAKKVARNIFTKGDYAFLSGDIVVQDEYGYVYFQDRTGDNFRWRGENVSTNEVESIISKALGMCDVIVYGVEIPEIEGRAGMVSIVDPEGLVDVGALVDVLEPLLPVYARPVFVRVGGSVELTGTFKFQKNKLKEEGFNINLVKDSLYYYDSETKAYLALDKNMYGKMLEGKVRL